jgi:hypothetical protein
MGARTFDPRRFALLRHGYAVGEQEGFYTQMFPQLYVTSDFYKSYITFIFIFYLRFLFLRLFLFYFRVYILYYDIFYMLRQMLRPTICMSINICGLRPQTPVSNPNLTYNLFLLRPTIFSSR